MYYETQNFILFLHHITAQKIYYFTNETGKLFKM